MKLWLGNSPEVQWLGLHNFTTEGMGSVSGLRTKIPQAMRCNQKIKVVTNLLIEEKKVLSFYYLFSLYCTACGILVHQPGIKCEPLHWKHRILTSGLPGNLKKQIKKKTKLKNSYFGSSMFFTHWTNYQGGVWGSISQHPKPRFKHHIFVRILPSRWGLSWSLYLLSPAVSLFTAGLIPFTVMLFLP